MEFLFWTIIIYLLFKVFSIESRMNYLERKLLLPVQEEKENTIYKTDEKDEEIDINESVPANIQTTETKENLSETKKTWLNYSLFKKTENGITFLGQKLIVWIAGFAAILGSFYLVQYSIEHSLLSPLARLCLISIFALSCIITGYFLYNKKNFANNERIAQALIGIGISTFYFVAYALSRIYHIVPANISFIMMCVITTLSVFLTLKCGGKPIAILSLIGGFLTPMLVGSNSDSAILLSSYLLIISFGFLILANKIGSILLLIFNLLGLYILISTWIFFGCHSFDSLWLMITLSTITFSTLRFCPKFDNLLEKTFKYGILGICFLFAFVFLFNTNFGILEWEIILTLIVAMLFLTFRDTKLYFPIFLSTISLCFLMLFLQKTNNEYIKNVVFILLAIIGILPFYISIWINKKQEFLKYLTIASPIIYGLHYMLFKNETILPYIGLIGGVLMVLPIIKFNFKDELGQKNSGLLILSSSTLFTLAFASLIQADFWPIVLSIEILLLGTLKTFFNIKYLDFGINTLFSGFLITQIFNITFMSGILLLGQLVKIKFSVSYLTSNFYISNIIIPTLSFGILALISKEKLKSLSTNISTLIGTFGLLSFYMLVKMKFLSIGQLSLNFAEHTFITNILLLSFAGFLFFKKNIFEKLFKFGLWRLIGITLILASPFLNKIQTSPISLCLAYGIPVALFSWYAFLSKENTRNNFTKLSALFSFVLVSSLLTQALYGTVCISKINFTNFGIFSYSILWLGLGVIWLTIAFRNKFLVKPAFGLIYFVVAKVFLFDVSSLSGIWRIVALFALAGSLLVISHFYTKYFQGQNRQ